jgi:NADPH:quinone reductase-like Zn-dependent oxidoreductase
LKAYTLKKYGSPADVLQLREIDLPEPKNKEVRVQVSATAVNDYDWCITTGRPYDYRILFGLFRPRKKLRVPGMEVAGSVEKVGKDVTKFRAGDLVYGDISEYGFGSFAEFLCIDERALTIKPKEMSFEEAASIPHASMLALQALRDIGKIEKDQDVLIIGGGGGMGSFALQIAKLYQNRVTGVDTGAKLKAMKMQGYDAVIDYKKEDFTKRAERYDLIVDCRTSRSLWYYLRALKPGGTYVSVGGRSGKLLQMLYMKPILGLFSTKRLKMAMIRPNWDLDYIGQLYEAGKIRCTIDGPYSFEELPKAVQRFGDASHHGKIVISLRSREQTD